MSGELDKARRIEATGALRTQAIERFRQQVAAWNAAVPITEPLVLDFGLGQFKAMGLVEVWIANELEAGYCGKNLFVADGQTCPMHHHKHKHETFYVVEGRVRVVCDGETIELGRGERLAVPPETRHCFTGLGPALLLELSQPCRIDDNYFDNTRIPIGGNYKGPGATS